VLQILVYNNPRAQLVHPPNDRPPFADNRVDAGMRRQCLAPGEATFWLEQLTLWANGQEVLDDTCEVRVMSTDEGDRWTRVQLVAAVDADQAVADVARDMRSVALEAATWVSAGVLELADLDQVGATFLCPTRSKARKTVAVGRWFRTEPADEAGRLHALLFARVPLVERNCKAIHTEAVLAIRARHSVQSQAFQGVRPDRPTVGSGGDPGSVAWLVIEHVSARRTLLVIERCENAAPELGDVTGVDHADFVVGKWMRTDRAGNVIAAQVEFRGRHDRQEGRPELVPAAETNDRTLSRPTAAA
jgi:hypothetical protein